MTRIRSLPPAARYALACAALIVAYGVVPVRDESDAGVAVLRWGIAAAMLMVIAVVIRWQAVRQIREPDAPLGGLIVGVVAGLLVFALVDYAIAEHRPDEFTGLRTRLDAVYFALTTLLTVGYGDIVPRGQIARGVVVAQMVFNVTALAGSASLVARKLAVRARRPNIRRNAARTPPAQ